MEARVVIVIALTVCLGVSGVMAGRDIDSGSITIVVDPRIELLAVIQSLGDYEDRYGLLTNFDFPYRRDVQAHFEPYREHAAVKLFAEMSADGFSFDAPPTAMLHLSPPPELSIRVPFTDYLSRRAGGADRLERFVEAMRDFAGKTGFMAFFNSHNRTFAEVTKATAALTEDCDYARDLEDYYRMRQSGYHIILGLLLDGGGYGPHLKHPDGTTRVYQICGPQGVQSERPAFGTRERMRYLLWHEFGHSFVNPTTEQFAEEIAASASLFEPIAGRMKSQAYGTWQICVNEHLIRAVTTRLAYINLGKDAGQRAAWAEKQRGFVYIEPLCEALQEYESQPEKYPSFQAFYPQLVSVFQKLSEEDLPDEFYRMTFSGTINAVISEKREVVLIAPTNETDPNAQEKIQEYVLKCRDNFFAGCPVYSDADALRRDLSDRSLIVYGTLQGNLWLAKHFCDLPIEVTPERITANGIYSGTDLRLITAWPHPQNSQRGIVVYTAQTAADIPQINGVYHGPTDYVIASGTKVLSAGDYNKYNRPWTLNRKTEDQD